MRVIVMFLAAVEVTSGFKIKSEKAKLVKVAIKSGQCGHDKTLRPTMWGLRSILHWVYIRAPRKGQN